MLFHRRLLWLTVMLAGLAAALLYLSGTASAESGSTSTAGSGNDSTSSVSTSSESSSEANTGESARESGATTQAVETSSATTHSSSLAAAVTEARDARLEVSAPSRQTAETTTATQTTATQTTATQTATQSTTVRAFQIEGVAAAEKTRPTEVESLSVAADEPEQKPLAAAVVNVLSELGTSRQQDPPATMRQSASTTTFAAVEANPVGDVNAVVEDPAAATAATADAAPALTPSDLPATTPSGVDGVVVGHSVLTIPCGPGYDLPADWYFPTGADPPTGMIWLQHGFLAQGPWYSKTAAELAKETNSIVVAPSITSNFLQCDGCWLNGDPMERAAASLLVDRTALTASASAAAGRPITLPDKFVLVGHSAGGGFATAVAGYLVGTPAIDKLAGVVMFDGVALNDSMTSALARIPRTVPVYQISAPSYIWNNFGSGTAQLEQARPGEFTGFQLAGGSHVDSMRGYPIIDFAAQLLTGFSPPGNYRAVQTLASGWINDMFNPGEHHGIYAEAGQTIKIGKATATALPTPPTWFTPIERLIRSTLLFVEQFLFGAFTHHEAPAAADHIAA